MKINHIFEDTKLSIPASNKAPRKGVPPAIMKKGGAHKDKKKAAKQGDVKHKGKEMSEAGIVDTVKSVATKVGDTLATAVPKDYRPFDNDTAAKNQQSMKLAKTESGDSPCWDGYKRKPGTKKYSPGSCVKESIFEALGKMSGYCDACDRPSDQCVCTKENHEYDDEAGMADNNLETLKRAVDGLDDMINTGDNLPEWCQEKIAVAKSMLITVWDYMQSEEKREPEVEEGMYRRPGSPTAYDRDYRSSVSGMGKRDSLAYQMDGGANDEGWGDEPYQNKEDKPVLKGYYFYDVPAGKENLAAIYGVKKTKSGKWAKALYSTSGRSYALQKNGADKEFGPGKFWSPNK